MGVEIMSTEKRYLKVTVTFERRDDGGLRAFSDDVPGFVLSHSNADAVVADVAPALQTMVSSILEAEVVIGELGTLRSELVDAGIIDGPAHEQFTREYVAEPVAA
jgi:hypothetical protein